MPKHPPQMLNWSDLPQPVPGADRYSISACNTGGYHVIKFSPTSERATVEHRPSQQAAFRAAIRLQKRANFAAASKAD